MIMIGFFDYSVWLTYISLLSATFGIMITLHGGGHPFIGVFFLMISGLCDAFDGRVARSKKNRTETQKGFGIQIDSLSDLVAFGVLPACIGQAMASVGPGISGVERLRISYGMKNFMIIFMLVSMLFYVLAAMIRLAYFNVIEEERQKTEGGCNKTYTGLPVTVAALIFPTLMLLQYIIPTDITILYFIVLDITAILFISKFDVAKPGLKGILLMVGVGLVEFILLLLCLLLIRHFHI